MQATTEQSVIKSRLDEQEKEIQFIKSQIKMQNDITKSKLEQPVNTDNAQDSIPVEQMNEEQLMASVRPTDDKDLIIQQLSDQLRLANDELLDIHEKNLETARLEAEGGDNKETIEQLKQDIEMMKTTMKEDDEKKAQDKEDIQILKDENEQLKQKIAFYEE